MSLPRDAFLGEAGLSAETLEVWINEEWIIPSGEGPDVTFTETDVARAKLVRDLTYDFRVNREGIGIVLHLLDQVHGLRQVLSELSHTNGGLPLHKERNE